MTKPRLPRPVLEPPYEVKIVADSVSAIGNRLTTFLFTYPRFVHADFMTYRMWSRNGASSRARPASKVREAVRSQPALPVFWGQNQSGMQARSELDSDTRTKAQLAWLRLMEVALETHEELEKLGLHKQLTNRILEPWMPMTMLVTATNFHNFFHQRDDIDPQPEMQVIATEAHYQYHENKPTLLHIGEWHTPFIEDDEQFVSIAEKKDVSVARCARLSYLTHEGVRDVTKDLELADKLLKTATPNQPGHFSPFEHVATPATTSEYFGNVRGWLQYRKSLPGEAGPPEVQHKLARVLQ